jgi:membrane-bound metal-dependent hydrolase YbcI (DUF457 family)
VDTITHGIAGALVAKSLGSKRMDLAAVFALTLGSVFPDSDTFATYFYSDRIAYLTIHRGLTHSFVMLPLFAAALGVATALILRRKTRWFFFTACYAAGIALHILMDLITSFGTMIWDPISNVRAAWDITFIVDVVFTSIVLLPQLAAWAYSDRTRARRRRLGIWIGWTIAAVAVALAARAAAQVPISNPTIVAGIAMVGVIIWMPSLLGGFEWPRSTFCRIGVATFAVYMLACTVAHSVAISRVNAFASSLASSPERIAALPAPPSLLRWTGFVQTSDGVFQVPLNLADSTPLRAELFPNARANEYVEAAKQLNDVKTFLWFARFPWITYSQRGETNLVEFRDLQFLIVGRGNNSPFRLTVTFDNQGQVLGSKMIER